MHIVRNVSQIEDEHANTGKCYRLATMWLSGLAFHETQINCQNDHVILMIKLQFVAY